MEHDYVFKFLVKELVTPQRRKFPRWGNKPLQAMVNLIRDDLGTEYLVRPLGTAEEEEASSDFEPEENGEEEDEGDDDDEDEKAEVPPKRKRSDKDEDDSDDDDGGEDDERPSKR
ncbi:hypothetical protein SESBI_27659 [Sesbania bispinosa]|nr:hypothetical protein SESBI_27659 [Sesbania bispinosa]